MLLKQPTRKLPIDLTGRRFGRLTVISILGIIKQQAHWNCRCDCGGSCMPATTSLTRGHSQSCGCLVIEVASKVGRTHGMHGSREYRIWQSIKSRCYRKHKAAHRYRDRGIVMCDRWLNSFEAFYADMGPCPAGMSIERENNDGNYEPSNCRWATSLQQANNTVTNHKLTGFGKTQSVSAWSRELSICRTSITNWLARGKTLEEVYDRFHCV
jgi:hypothetical protein